jgi:hypothetical protein
MIRTSALVCLVQFLILSHPSSSISQGIHQASHGRDCYWMIPALVKMLADNHGTVHNFALILSQLKCHDEYFLQMLSANVLPILANQLKRKADSSMVGRIFVENSVRKPHDS